MIRGWRRLATGAAVLAALSLGHPARAEIVSADLRVNGMACPFCAFGIEKKLLDVDGVKSVEVLLDEGRLHLELSPNSLATTAALEAAVEKAGFELAGLSIEARGTLAIEEGETWLEVHRGQRFLLTEEGGQGGHPLPPATREQLPVDDRGQVVVSGRVVGSRLVVDPPRTEVGRAW